MFTTPNSRNQRDGRGKHGHIGMMNKDRLRRFIEKYHHRIVVESFYLGKKLVSCDPDLFINNDPLASFDDVSKTHLRLVLQ